MADVFMSGTFVPGELQSAQAPAENTAGSSRRGKGKYSKLNWDGHKAHLQDLYLVQNNSLVETMRRMKEEYAFEATPRVYKDKFKQWGWQKNLPSKHAKFMVHKATDRKRNERKDTVFEYGGQQWDSNRAKNTLTRTKKAANDDDVIDMNTPASVAYKTPKELAPTPRLMPSAEDSDEGSVESISRESEDEGVLQAASDSEDQELLLSWQGNSRTDLDNMWQTGQSLAEQGNLSQAAVIIFEAFQGMCHVLGDVHEQTTKTAYYLADLYTRQGRSDKADPVIEQVTKSHVEILGLEHKKTQQHILYCVELLNAWNRSLDALAFITRAEEISDRHQNGQGRRHRGSSNDKGKSVVRPDLGSGATSRTSDLPRIADNDHSQIDYYLDRARSHVKLKDDAVEAFLQEIIRQCQRYHPTLHIQHLRARSELLKLYISTNRVLGNFQAFDEARWACNDVLNGYEWEEDKFESIEVMEAALQVASDILKGGYDRFANPLFRRASEIAANIFGSDDERTIWIQITIGLVFQSNRDWSLAEEWFEMAFAGALQAFNHKDGIVMSLQRAIDKKHFSYISDEGRPFKTIFGISGIVIRPGRLHLD